MLQPNRNDRINGDGTAHHSYNQQSAGKTNQQQTNRTQQTANRRDKTSNRRLSNQQQPSGSTAATPAGKEQSDSLPLGFRLTATTLAGFSLLLMYAGIVLVSGASEVAAYSSDLSTSFTLVGLLLLGLSAGHLGTAYGLWTLKPWGRKAAFGLVVVSLTGSILTLAQGGPAGVYGLGLYGAMAWYLHDNETQYQQLHQQNQSSRPA